MNNNNSNRFMAYGSLICLELEQLNGCFLSTDGFINKKVHT